MRDASDGDAGLAGGVATGPRGRCWEGLGAERLLSSRAGLLLSQSFQFQDLLVLVCVFILLPFIVLSLWVIRDLQAANYDVYIPMKRNKI